MEEALQGPGADLANVWLVLQITLQDPQITQERLDRVLSIILLDHVIMEAVHRRGGTTQPSDRSAGLQMSRTRLGLLLQETGAIARLASAYPPDSSRSTAGDVIVSLFAAFVNLLFNRLPIPNVGEASSSLVRGKVGDKMKGIIFIAV